MKIFKMIIPTLYAITLLMVMPSFGMSEKPHKDNKSKKVFGPTPLIVPETPANVEQWRQEKRKQQSSLANEQNDAKLFELCKNSIIDHSRDVQLDIQETAALLQKGANPNITDETGALTPLHLLVSNRRKAPLVKLLLEWKANPQVKDSQQTTPLHVAAMNNNIYAVRYLFKAGAQETPHNGNNLPSHYATFTRNTLTRPLFWRLHIAEDSPSQQEYAAYRKQLLPLMRQTLTDSTILPNDLQNVIASYIPEALHCPDDLTTTLPENRECLLMQTNQSARRRSIDESKDDKTKVTLRLSR